MHAAADGRDRRRRSRQDREGRLWCGAVYGKFHPDQRSKGPRLTELFPNPLAGWRYGIHPNAVGMQIRLLGRVELPLGEALRLEMGYADPGGEDVAHIQYYIWTEAGAWALWLSCARRDLVGREAALRELSPPFMETP